MVFAFPAGLFLLKQIDPLLFRYLVATMARTAPLMMVCRFSADLVKSPLLYSTWTFSGILVGLVGINGPPVIILYVSSRLLVRIIRVSNMMFLFYLSCSCCFVSCCKVFFRSALSDWAGSYYPVFAG